MAIGTGTQACSGRAEARLPSSLLEQCYRIYIMAVKDESPMSRTMSVSIDETLYHQLKRNAGPRAMSRFIAEALREKLHGGSYHLRREYVAAGKDKARREALRDWDSLDTVSVAKS